MRFGHVIGSSLANIHVSSGMQPFCPFSEGVLDVSGEEFGTCTVVSLISEATFH